MGVVRWWSSVGSHRHRQSVRRASTLLNRISSTWPTLARCDLGGLSQPLLDALQKSLHQPDLALILRDPEDGVFRVCTRSAFQERDLSRVQFAQDSPLIRHFAAHPVPAHYGQLRKVPWLSVLPKQMQEPMAMLEGRLFVPLSANGALVGLLALRDRKTKPMRRAGYGLGARDLSRPAGTTDNGEPGHQSEKPSELSAPSLEEPKRAEQVHQMDQTTKVIAHDLNNILTTILAHAQLLEDEGAGDELQGHTGAIRQAARDGAESVRRMRGLTKHPSDPTSGRVEVNDLVRSTLQMIAPRWRQGRISDSCLLEGRSLYGLTSEANTGAGDLPRPPREVAVSLRPAGYVWGSAADLRRVLTNIIDNAIDSLPAEHGRIEIDTSRDNQWARIMVKDNGVGMSPEICGRIFEPLFTTKGDPGHGLGLSISQSIVALHGGKLGVQSEKGAGSTFTISLPLARSEVGPS